MAMSDPSPTAGTDKNSGALSSSRPDSPSTTIPPPPRPGSPIRKKLQSTEDDDIPRTSSTASIPRQLPTIATPQILRKQSGLFANSTVQVQQQLQGEFVADDQSYDPSQAGERQELAQDDGEDDEDDEDEEQFAASGERRQLKYLLCGAVAGAVSRTCTAPLDRLKVLLQTQITPQPSSLTSPPPKPSTLAALKTSLANLRSASLAIYADGGLRSFWRGNGMNCVKIVPESAIKFYVFEQAKRAVAIFQGCDPDDPETNIGVHGRFVAGGIGGLASQFSIYPIETLKTRVMAATQARAMATHAAAVASREQRDSVMPSTAPAAPSTIPARSFATLSAPKPSTSLVVTTAREMWSEGGWRVHRSCHLRNPEIDVYARMHAPLVRDPHLHPPATPPVMWLLVFGTLSGSIGATAVYPLSLIRTRLQAQGTPGHPERYSGAMDAVRKTYAREGGRGFYKGLAPTLIKVIPAASISYVCYEGMKGVVGL
ncbi:mitochondrial carrier domain-containing protein [Catenaria anguillulae PL171]|uniref:Mitochondrial carrier domain-containing protein n=1 Tax=Catenaria anguillulae PL171 TaxID=765915 RepID=A0A1Y2I1L8_9FUNG|nr:mitochondrial carrier domain-containing protein [Catenaria anguillulae PL171]